MVSRDTSSAGFWQMAFRSHGPSVLAFLERRLGRKEEAEDLLQETFVRAIRAGSFLEGGPLRAYLLRIAKNLLINRLRRPRLVLPPEFGVEDEDPFAQVADAQQPTPEEGAVWTSLRIRLKEALGRLSADQRRAFDLVSVEQCSYQEIARATGWSPSQVKINVFRARKKLIAELGDVLSGERAKHATPIL